MSDSVLPENDMQIKMLTKKKFKSSTEKNSHSELAKQN